MGRGEPDVSRSVIAEAKSRLVPAAPQLVGEDQTLAELAYRSLKRDIIAGVRPGGERMRLEKLRNIYGIGPTPLREALQRLSADGLVIAEGRRGFRVAPLNAADFMDLNLARIEVELPALRLSIQHGDEAWEASIVAAAYRLEKADRLLAASDAAMLDAWESLNTTFHRTLVSACPSRWLLRMRDILNDQSDRYRRASVYRERMQRNLLEEHRAIAEAVLARDEERACRLVKGHYERTGEGLVRVLGE